MTHTEQSPAARLPAVTLAPGPVVPGLPQPDVLISPEKELGGMFWRLEGWSANPNPG